MENKIKEQPPRNEIKKLMAAVSRWKAVGGSYNALVQHAAEEYHEPEEDVRAITGHNTTKGKRTC